MNMELRVTPIRDTQFARTAPSVGKIAAHRESSDWRDPGPPRRCQALMLR